MFTSTNIWYDKFVLSNSDDTRTSSVSRYPLFTDTSQPQTDELALLDEDDSRDPDDPEDETQEMDIPAGFRIQESKPAVLDSCFCNAEC